LGKRKFFFPSPLLDIIKKFLACMALKSALQTLSRFFYAEFTVKIHLLATDTHGYFVLPTWQSKNNTRPQGALTIYRLVCSPVDKVFCLCSSVCAERAQRAGGKFLCSGVQRPRHKRWIETGHKRPCPIRRVTEAGLNH